MMVAGPEKEGARGGAVARHDHVGTSSSHRAFPPRRLAKLITALVGSAVIFLIPQVQLSALAVRSSSHDAVAWSSTPPIPHGGLSRYLLYGATSGWANQLQSMEHAYWMALATERTLVLPPALHHRDAVQRTYSSIDVGEGDLDRVSVFYNSMRRVRLPMKSILDFSSWDNAVPVIDYDEFASIRKKQRWAEVNTTSASGRGWSTKEFEKEVFNCERLKYTMNVSRHGVEETAPSCQDHVSLNRDQPKTYTYRHVATSLQEHVNADAWSFQFLFPNAMFDLKSFEPSPFQVHYAPPVREARRELVRSWGPYSKYAAAHVRASDGPYRNRDWRAVVPRMFGALRQDILDYVGRRGRGDRRVTLVVVSDVPIWSAGTGTLHTVWKEEEGKLMQSLRQGNVSTVDLRIVHSNDREYSNATTVLKSTLRTNEAGVYLDQLLAACADVTFVGSETLSSSFQRRIRFMRGQASSPCM